MLSSLRAEHPDTARECRRASFAGRDAEFHVAYPEDEGRPQKEGCASWGNG